MMKICNLLLVALFSLFGVSQHKVRYNKGDVEVVIYQTKASYVVEYTSTITSTSSRQKQQKESADRLRVIQYLTAYVYYIDGNTKTNFQEWYDGTTFEKNGNVAWLKLEDEKIKNNRLTRIYSCPQNFMILNKLIE